MVAQRFGANLAAARERVDVTQEEIAFRAGLHRTEIGLLERGGRIPRIDTLVKLAGALGVEPADLLDGIRWEPGQIRRGAFKSAGEET
ncbi:MAG TPA: helix-turn-helix transcriptional regulator [Solirubrobacterales bacterium]|jgi:transcriptional regulator with XRE-family HTH domain